MWFRLSLRAEFGFVCENAVVLVPLDPVFRNSESATKFRNICCCCCSVFGVRVVFCVCRCLCCATTAATRRRSPAVRTAAAAPVLLCTRTKYTLHILHACITIFNVQRTYTRKPANTDVNRKNTRHSSSMNHKHQTHIAARCSLRRPPRVNGVIKYSSPDSLD